MAKSYAGQGNTFSIPVSEGITEIPLGFQPMGMSVQRVGVLDAVAVAAYYEPAVMEMAISTGETGLLGNVTWIRDVNHGIDSVRLFTGHPTFGDKDRAQCVILNADGTVWVSRNGERTFFVLSPPQQENGRRTLVSKFTLPSDDMRDQIHAAYLDSNGMIHTTESTQSQDEWCRRCYRWSLAGWVKADIIPCPTLTYGLAQRPGPDGGELWTISDFRSNNPNKGLYRGDDLVLPSNTIQTASGQDGLCGNGLAFLQNGALLISRYGQGYPGCFNGIPGALLHVPAAMLK